MNLLPLHSNCIYEGNTKFCKKCIARHRFKPKCEKCLFFKIPIPRICRDCMFMETGTHQYWEERT